MRCTGTLLPGGTSFLVLGLSEINAPFKLGIMVPAIDVFLKPIFIDGQGEVFIGGTWGSAIPSGGQFWRQYWWADPGGPAGFAGTNAVRATGP